MSIHAELMDIECRAKARQELCNKAVRDSFLELGKHLDKSFSLPAKALLFCEYGAANPEPKELPPFGYANGVFRCGLLFQLESPLRVDVELKINPDNFEPTSLKFPELGIETRFRIIGQLKDQVDLNTQKIYEALKEYVDKTHFPRRPKEGSAAGVMYAI